MQNGRLPSSALAPIPGGKLYKPAAAAWLAMYFFVKRKTGVRLRPGGPLSSYRPLWGQIKLWNLYRSGRGNLAARPGTSNHGWGLAVDLMTRTMRRLVDRYGAAFGWAKKWSDAPSEWWHIRWRAGVWHRPDPLRALSGYEHNLVKELQQARRRKDWPRANLLKRKIAAQMGRLAHAVRADHGRWGHYSRGVRYQILKKAHNNTL